MQTEMANMNAKDQVDLIPLKGDQNASLISSMQGDDEISNP